jgi:hypothetical protein
MGKGKKKKNRRKKRNEEEGGGGERKKGRKGVLDKIQQPFMINMLRKYQLDKEHKA